MDEKQQLSSSSSILNWLRCGVVLGVCLSFGLTVPVFDGGASHAYSRIFLSPVWAVFVVLVARWKVKRTWVDVMILYLSLAIAMYGISGVRHF